MKYITYINQLELADIRIFSSMVKHSNVEAEMDFPDLLGAGFIEFEFDGTAECYGHSESLKLDSRKELDTKILQRFMKMSRRN